MTSLINRFFHKKNSQSTTQGPQEKKSVILLPLTDKDIDNPAENTSPYIQLKNYLGVAQLIVGVAQDVGIQRDHNEDSLFTLTANLLSDKNLLKFGLYIVADGMGGHENGEIASSVAVSQMTSHVISSLYLPLLSDSNNKMDLSIQEILKNGVMKAHHIIKKEAFGSGTTLTSALIIGDQLTIAHVGDSRAYSISANGKLKLLTHDHSLVKRLEDLGQISPEQASIHPQRNVLYRALGQADLFEPDIASFHLQPGDQLLICSDGLWGVIPEDELARVINSSLEPQLACQTLVDLANQAGGPDNISVILVRITE